MYEECCPGMELTYTGNVAQSVRFVLMYTEPQDSRFFWAALLYDNKVWSEYTEL